jgi:hypothetical protein
LTTKPQINQNLSIFEWNLALMSQYQRCFSFAISDYIARQAIKSVVIHSKPFGIFGCSIDTAQQQMALNFELLVSNQLFSVVLAAYK